VNLVIIDGLCLGIEVSGEKQKNEILRSSLAYLDTILLNIFKTQP